MNGSAAKEARRDVRRAFGSPALQTLDKAFEAVQTCQQEIGRLRAVLGETTDVDLFRPLISRLRIVEHGLEDLAKAWQLRLDAEMARDKTFRSRLTWLLRGPRT